MRGGKRVGSGRKHLPIYLKRKPLTGVRIPLYKIRALQKKGRPSLLVEQALDEKYLKEFNEMLAGYQRESLHETEQKDTQTAAETSIL